MQFDINKAVDARRFSLHAKATVQRTGKLGFSMEAAELLGLRENTSELKREGRRMILQEMDGHDWLAVVVSETNERGFKIQRGGDYYYLNMRQYFKASGIDYLDNRVIYDITATNETYEGSPVYLFKFRQHLSRRKEEATTADVVKNEKHQ